jgi:hypothetical protein
MFSFTHATNAITVTLKTRDLAMPLRSLVSP